MDPDRLAELEEERRFLLRSIADLDREHAAGDVDDHDFATLHDGYVARAAVVLREIENDRAALPGKRRRPRVIAAVVALTLAVAALAGWMVAHYSGQRTDAGGQLLPADEITQDLAAARVAFAQQNATAAIDAYKSVLQLDPTNVEAITYAGWLIVTSGVQSEQSSVVDIGVDQIRKAIATDPTYPDAHCLLGVALAEFVAPPDPVGAKTELTTCEANNPPALIHQLVDPVLASLEPSSTLPGSTDTASTVPAS
jgi:hypothetical protein